MVAGPLPRRGICRANAPAKRRPPAFYARRRGAFTAAGGPGLRLFEGMFAMRITNGFNKDLLDGVRRLHFIGIGGSGMYPLVQILASKGYEITGSDVNEGHIIEDERAMGIPVFMDHKPENIEGADMIVYSAAIHEENPELQAAHIHGIPCVERSVMLGYVCRLYQRSICVAGTHGKTTTTSMITSMLELAGRDPSAVIGGKLPLIGGYGKAGNGPSIVIEACEYAETFLRLAPTIGIVLNIDNDHLDYYGTLGQLKFAFKRFALLCRHMIIVNADDANTMQVMDSIDRDMRTFAIERRADYQAVNIQEYKPGYFEFDALEFGDPFAHIRLGAPGRHNIYNALAMLCCVRPLGLTPDDAVRAAEHFRGAGRRFELKGEVNGAAVADDYAHHPTELRATLQTAREMDYKRIWAVHQPFTYSRTRMLLDDFAEVLQLADRVVLTPIMGGRELDDGSVKSEDLAARIPGSVVVESLAAAAEYIRQNARPGDLVITLGCGDVYKASDLMVGPCG